MAESILGLLSTAKFRAQGEIVNSHRRGVFHIFPNGGAPLCGLLSMLESEPVTSTIYDWREKRYVSPSTLTRGTNPLTSTAPTTGDANDGTAATAGALANTATLYLKVDSTVNLRKGLIVQVEGGTGNYFQLWITGVTRGVADETLLGYVTCKLIRSITYAAGDVHAVGTTNADAVVRVISSAYGEGSDAAALSPIGFKRPITIQNTTQIFKTVASWTGSVLQQPVQFDKTGIYREDVRDKSLEHMTSIERAIIFGQRSTTMRDALDGSGEQEEVRTMSGIIEFLELWDAGTTGKVIDGATYAPYTHKGPSTLDTDDQKRIIANADGTLTITKFEKWAERVSRYNSTKTRDKLVLCGTGALLAFSSLFRNNSSYTVKEGDSVYGLDFTTLITMFGKFHFLTHPMFNEDPVMANWALVLDPHTIKLRPLQNRDTRLLKNVQTGMIDKRIDMYITELGLELHRPECNMLIKNISTYTVG